MDTFSSFEFPFRYSDDDSYIRAIRFNMIRRNGEIKISAFKSNRGGVSVTRTNDAVYDKAMGYMMSNFEGTMAVFPVKVCKDYLIYEEHSPSHGHNFHHWKLYGDAAYNELSMIQIIALIKASVIK